MHIPNPFNPLVKLDKEILNIRSLGILGALGAILLEGILTLILSYIPIAPTTSTSLKYALIKFLLELSITLLVIYFLSMVLFIKDRQPFNYNKFYFKDLVFCAFIIIGLRLVYSGTIEHITSSMIMPTFIEEAFKEAAINPIYFILSVAILAPIKEEFLYRGIVFNGLSKRYPYGVAIILSSLLFGIAHLNIPQGINAFFIGVVISYVYYHTKSFYLCIFMHFFNNLFVSCIGLTMPKDLMILGSVAFALLGFLFIFYGFKNLNLKEKRSLRENNFY